MNRKFVRKIRSSRDIRELNRVLRNADPSMQQELMAASARQSSRVI
jgi:hypothetical protein